MRFLALLLLAVSCGGGGGSAGVSSPPSIPQARTVKAHACYFGMSAGDVTTTADHADCVDAGGWSVIDQLATLTQTKGTGRPVVLMFVDACAPGLPLEQVEGEVTAWLERIASVGLLDQNIAGVRPCDEPKGSDADVKARITAVHAAMAKFPQTLGKPIAIYYPCSDASFPGLEFVDLPGCDAYDWSFDRVVAVYASRLENLGSDIHPVFIVGCSDPWRGDPTPYVTKVLTDGRYWGVQGFGWGVLGSFPNGCSTNGLAPLYRAQFGRLR